MKRIFIQCLIITAAGLISATLQAQTTKPVKVKNCKPACLSGVKEIKSAVEGIKEVKPIESNKPVEVIQVIETVPAVSPLPGQKIDFTNIQQEMDRAQEEMSSVPVGRVEKPRVTRRR